MQAVLPGRDCPLCPRLAAFRESLRAARPDWHNAPVPPFGPSEARLLIVGLAPGKSGANRTGRPFTGDGAGDLLYPMLTEIGLLQGAYGRSPDDGLAASDCRITNAVRCVPPENRPNAVEIATCRDFLRDEIAALPRLRAVLALGRIAHESVLAVFGLRPRAFPFAHGARHSLADGPILLDSYHCSRQNTNTGRLTPAMFRSVLTEAKRLIEETRA